MRPREPGDPERIASYRVLGRLGAGGMGTVYLAQNERGTPVAVKTILASGDLSFPARFAREVEAALRVSSPYTARVLDADTGAEPPYLVTEYVAGETLRDRIDRAGPLEEKLVVATAVGLAAGLEAIHRVGVAHRDLSAANVMLTVDGPRIIDLGIASVEDGTRLTRTGTALGTPGFMAPEHARGDPVGAPADVFAWGSLTVFAATGVPPFGTGRAEQVLYRIVHEQPSLEGVPSVLLDHVTAALAKDPAERPTADSLVKALGRELGHAQPGDGIDHPAVAALVSGRWREATTQDDTTPIGVSEADDTQTAAAGAGGTAPQPSSLSAPDQQAMTENISPRRHHRRGTLLTASLLGAFVVAAAVFARLPDTAPPEQAQASASNTVDAADEHNEAKIATDLTDQLESRTEPRAQPDEPVELQPDPEPDDTAADETDEAPSADPEEPSELDEMNEHAAEQDETPEAALSDDQATGPPQLRLPNAPWQGGPVPPESRMEREVAAWWAEWMNPDCGLYYPIGYEEARGVTALPPLVSRAGPVELLWEKPAGESDGLMIGVWGTDAQHLAPIIEGGPVTEFADGSLLYTGNHDGMPTIRLLAISGQKCFYEISARDMNSLDWGINGLREVALP